MLAQSAWRNGYCVDTLDLFADVDTRRYARRGRVVRADDALRLDMRRIECALHEWQDDYGGIVCGAGFEREAHWLDYLARRTQLIGNDTVTVTRVKQPQTWCALLDQVGLPYPLTTLQRPREPAGWLAKIAGGQGGTHVRRLSDAAAGCAHTYYQREIDAMPYSVLFLADGRECRSIGFSRQLTQAIGTAPYCYAGAISHAHLPRAVVQHIEAALPALVASSGLRGLNSLDFLLAADGKFYVLEINPRPSATLDLYDADCRGGLFAWHLRACRGELVHDSLTTQQPRGHLVVYAPQAMQIPQPFSWPDWCSDIEQDGACVEQHQPLCMLHAVGNHGSEVEALLQQRRAALLQLVQP